MANYRLQLTARLFLAERPQLKRSVSQADKGKILSVKKLVYQFKVSLNEIEPAIWRRIVVPATYSFWVRIPSHSGHRSEANPATIPTAKRPPFRGEGGHRSDLIPATFSGDVGI